MSSTDEKNTSALEKAGMDHVEHRSDDSSDYVEYDEAEKRAITRRIDRRLVIVTGITYCVSLMDRTNLSAASLAGMNVELKMNIANNGYSITTLVFFVTYILFQPPATVATRKIGPRNFLSAICLLWGAVMIGMGFVKKWEELMALRLVLGVFEAGYFPGAVYLLSTWYTRYEMGKRYAVFYIVGCVASAFAGILAYGLMQMNGLEGLTGWRWIFIMQGVITCVIAIIAYIFLVPFPDADAHKSWGFLNKSEVNYIIRKVNDDRGDVHLEPFTLIKFLGGGADFKVWCFGLIFCFSTTVTYSLAYFLPIILHGGMGFSIAASQCLVAPPYAFAGIWMFICGWAGDKYKFRGPIIVVNCLSEILGVCLMGWGPSNGVKFLGVFFACAGANCNVPLALTYQANNIRGQWKRAFCSATLVGLGGLGGIIGGLVFRPQDAPSYRPGLYACLAAAISTIIIVGLLSLYFKIENGKADRGEKKLEGGEEGFRYTI
ncbi:hypothetical protein TWF569_006080 [Orbilia oligospora]|uniref:Major facilitator superfamily (MFS) profile domain-containing protein n=1 Tax=Orbilia oligospora TaxID=2813651 RepID=A0A7C8NPW6_ORBOL|nr:hypothetical protein TWF706_011011 [Orbilia oligospora]KAF3104095.1 hypothetical protein TWF102_003466 [Orbilia oligospora]KAF3115463.1 hypothetical protein TWF103_010879 [Orbilia oligospora]KAF3139785.1 hypothetical protein TWF594_006640 [Orbilia oligospora]KAF3144106.1 hypothetical protein TWF703_009400 [Orbilia oligospora]